MRGRKPRAFKIWNLCISEDIAGKIDIVLTDPLTGRTRFGARSQLVTRLLAQELERLSAHQQPNTTEPKEEKQ